MKSVGGWEIGGLLFPIVIIDFTIRSNQIECAKKWNSNSYNQ